eukprot:TRINITY_DN5592_c0_g2_i1.p1 TRINITY_DN5592_c0_g2~~TRINITY_DN5592_c0_g2_i1.p1  ORF type:complete len:309 (+),score=75.80 TRINITY_DN5592_c0_g2_i1:1-927(+)
MFFFLRMEVTAVVTHDNDYIQSIKIFNTGIKEDPVPGEKRGKGVQHLNSGYWINDLGVFIAANLAVMQAFLRQAFAIAEKGGPGADFRYLLNQANTQYIRAVNGGLQTQEAVDYFLMASWLAMAAAEVDLYNYSKYDPAKRAEMRLTFYNTYSAEVPITTTTTTTTSSGDGGGGGGGCGGTMSLSSGLGKYDCPVARIDLIPPVALERLGIHNELCAIKWPDPTTWKRQGFQVSKRIDSLSRHFDSAHARDYSEDHMAHLVWNFMAIYHVLRVFPHMNDLTSFDALRLQNQTPQPQPHPHWPTDSLTH